MYTFRHSHTNNNNGRGELDLKPAGRPIIFRLSIFQLIHSLISCIGTIYMRRSAYHNIRELTTSS